MTPVSARIPPRITVGSYTYQRIVRVDTYDGNDVLDSYTIYEYDEDGFSTGYFSYTGDGQLSSYALWEYDANEGTYYSACYDSNDRLTSEHRRLILWRAMLGVSGTVRV